MRSIILVIFAMSILFMSGCHFSLIEGGFVEQTENKSFKLGSVSTDFLFANTEQNDEYKQRTEEDLKEQGIVIGVFYKRKF